MIIDQTNEYDELSARSIKVAELKELLQKYNNKEDKLKIEETSCKIGWGKDGIIHFDQNKEIRRIGWKDILKLNMVFLTIPTLICAFDLLTFESKFKGPFILLSVFSLILIVLYIVFLLTKRDNSIIFTITENGILKDDKLYNWGTTNILLFEKRGQPHLLLKKIREEEIAISLYFMRYYPSRIICWIDRYKTNYENISARKHSD